MMTAARATTITIATNDATIVSTGTVGAVVVVVAVGAVVAVVEMVAVVDFKPKSMGYHPRPVSQYGTPPEYALVWFGQFVQ